MSANFFEVGVVTSPAGLKGEIRIFPTTDDPERFRRLTEVFIGEIPRTILGLRFHKNMVVLKLSGIDTVEAAEALKGQKLKIPPEYALPLEEGQYYHRDLIDMRVFCEDGEDLGILNRIISTAANDVYTVCGNGREILIPAIKQCILDVDVAGKRMTVRLLPGLRDL